MFSAAAGKMCLTALTALPNRLGFGLTALPQGQNCTVAHVYLVVRDGQKVLTEFIFGGRPFLHVARLALCCLPHQTYTCKQCKTGNVSYLHCSAFFPPGLILRVLCRSSAIISR